MQCVLWGCLFSQPFSILCAICMTNNDHPLHKLTCSSCLVPTSSSDSACCIIILSMVINYSVTIKIVAPGKKGAAGPDELFQKLERLFSCKFPASWGTRNSLCII